MTTDIASRSRYRRALSPDSLRGDLVSPDSPFFGLVWINRERVSGAPCFAGTRVPVKNLFDYLEDGYNIEEFMSDFEGVEREQVIGVIELARTGLLAEMPRS